MATLVCDLATTKRTDSVPEGCKGVRGDRRAKTRNQRTCTTKVDTGPSATDVWEYLQSKSHNPRFSNVTFTGDLDSICSSYVNHCITDNEANLNKSPKLSTVMGKISNILVRQNSNDPKLQKRLAKRYCINTIRRIKESNPFASS